MTREADCRRLAERMGWTYSFGPGEPYFWSPIADGIPIPAPAAPLHEALAFVGRIAEAIGHSDEFSVGIEGRAAEVCFGERRVAGDEWPRPIIGIATDLSWAAVRAAIEAKGEK